MQGKEFSNIRHYLGKSQKQLAQLLCVSTKAIQSFEQGWRKIPANAERQLLLFLSFKRSLDNNSVPCWEIKNCPIEWRENCTAWEFKAGYLCWFINGTFCQGKVKESWREKIKICRHCKVFRSRLQLREGNLDQDISLPTDIR
jgi:DNA-binding XRE family transcriptional regulator